MGYATRANLGSVAASGGIVEGVFGMVGDLAQAGGNVGASYFANVMGPQSQLKELAKLQHQSGSLKALRSRSQAIRQTLIEGNLAAQTSAQARSAQAAAGSRKVGLVAIGGAAAVVAVGLGIFVWLALKKR